MVRPFFIIALLVSIATWAAPIGTPSTSSSRTDTPVAIDQLLEGTTILIGPKGNQQEFVVERWLGKGGFKFSYLVRSTDPQCSIGCQQVVGIYRDASIDLDIPHSVRQMFEQRTAPHVRREQPNARVVIDRTAYRAAASEYFPSTTYALPWKTDGGPQALEIFGQQLYSGIQSFTDVGAVHLDIKPANIFIAGRSPPTIEGIVSGENYFVLGDHDIIRPRGSLAETMGTPTFMPPEILNLRQDILANRGMDWGSRLDGKVLTHESSSIWSAAMSLWTIYANNMGSNELKGHFVDSQDAYLTTTRAPSDRRRQNVEDIRQLVHQSMTRHARELNRAGKPKDSAAVLRLRERILSGLRWNPHDRQTRWPEESVPLSKRIYRRVTNQPGHTHRLSTASGLRNGSIARHLIERHRAWTHANSSCGPDLDQVVRTLPH